MHRRLECSRAWDGISAHDVEGERDELFSVEGDFTDTCLARLVAASVDVEGFALPSLLGVTDNGLSTDSTVDRIAHLTVLVLLAARKLSQGDRAVFFS